MATPHDAAWKLLFSFPAMPLDLLAGFIPREWVANLDLSAPRRGHPGAGLKHRPGSLVSNGLRQRHSDAIWEVRFRDRPGSILVALEFQSTVDPTMAVRMLVYTALLYQSRLRSREPAGKQDASSKPESPERQTVPSGRDRPDHRESPGSEAPAGGSSASLPPVLPIVLYHGKAQWQAKEDVAGLCAPPAEGLAPYQPAQRYFLLDLGHFPGPLPEGRNLMAILVRLVQSRSLEQEAAVVDELIEWLHEESAPEGLVRAFWAWMGYAHVPEWRQGMDWPVLEDWREAGTMLRESVNEWTTKWMAQGRTQGRTEVMRRQAARKFGPETAERLDRRLAEIADPERTLKVGEWLLECDSGEELLDRVARLCESSTTGDGAPPS